MALCILCRFPEGRNKSHQGNNSHQTLYQNSERRAGKVSQQACNEAADWKHASKSHYVIAYHPAAHTFIHIRLQIGVGGRNKSKQTRLSNHNEDERHRQVSNIGKQNKADTKKQPGDNNYFQ